MRIIFDDMTVKEQPFNVERMARLIRLSQKTKSFRVELNLNRSVRERQAQAKQVEDYIHWLNVNNK